jgi:hypothetical protein
MAFEWRMEFPIVRNIYQHSEKLDDTKCEMYALLLWNNTDPTPINCIDIDEIPSVRMLNDPAKYCLIPVFVSEMSRFSPWTVT